MDFEKIKDKRFRNSNKFLLSEKDLENLGLGAETFELFTFENQEGVKEHIKDCEGKHIQQVAYSSYHDALTQICFTCKKIRTSLKEEDLK